MALLSSYITSSSFLLLLYIALSQQKRVFNQPPSIVKEPRAPLTHRCSTCDKGSYVLVYYKLDTTVTLGCAASGSPSPTYKWTKNGVEVNLNDTFYISSATNLTRIVMESGDGSLIISEVTEEDAGIYQCFASNKLGTALSKKVHLIQAINDHFPLILVPEEVTATLGDSLTLSCNLPRSIPKASVFWSDSSDPVDEVQSRIKLNERVTMDYTGNLHFANVNVSDEQGSKAYVCNTFHRIFRSNTQGEDKIIKIEGSVDPKEVGRFQVQKRWTSNTTVLGLQGEQAKFKCIFGGNPTPTIAWSRKKGVLDQERMIVGSSGHELIINNLQLKDQGRYTCQGSNTMRKPVSVEFTLKVESKPRWVIPPDDKTIGVEESTDFQCLANGLPSPRVEWFINGKPIGEVVNNRRRLVNNQLSFTRVHEQDSQVIQCLATNVHGSIWADVYLNVLALEPEITSEPGLMTVAEGQQVTLTCENNGKPTPTLTWRKGSQILNGARYEFTQDSITIKNVSKITDIGDYECEAKNRYGTKLGSGHLIVRSKTVITYRPIPKKVLNGKNAFFKCTAITDSNEIKRLKINWLHNGEPVDVGSRDIDITASGIRIKNTKSSDTGNYTCVASNGIDETSASAELRVEAPPDPPTVLHMLTCGEKDVELRWDGARDNFKPITKYIVEQNTMFEPDKWLYLAETDGLTEVKADLSPWVNYTFRVRAENELGVGEPSDPTTTICKTAEALPGRHPSNVKIIEDKTGYLIVEWDPMYPKEHNGPEFRYSLSIQKEGETNREVFNIDDYLETRKSIPTNDVYQKYFVYLEAKNKIGGALETPLKYSGYSGMAAPTVVPENFEEDPDYNMTYLTAGFRWDRVDESPDKIRGKLKGYMIRYWLADEPERTMKKILVRKDAVKGGRVRREIDNKIRAVVNNLPAFSNLQLDVVVSNTYFNSNASNVINVTTPEGVPSKVQNLHAENRGVNHFKLAWNEPVHHNGHLTGYKVVYVKVVGLDFSKEEEFSGQIWEDFPGRFVAQVGGLEQNSQYRITVFARTATGYGDGQFIDVVTATPGDPAVPFIVRVTPAYDSINVTWDIEKNHGRAGIEHFVEYRQQGTYKWYSMPGETVKKWQVVNNLTAGNTYEVLVAAVSGKEFKRSDLRTVTTLGAQIASAPAVYEHTWFIIMMVALAVIIIGFIIVCLVKRSRGDKYHVQEKEKLRGLDAEDKKTTHVNEFNENGEKQPLAAAGSDPDLEKGCADSEQDSLEEYGDVDPSRFNEDGSFIGQYGAQNEAADHTNDKNQTSAMHTFV